MNRITDYQHLKLRIAEWLKAYVTNNKLDALVVGVSGGIDSAVSSTLAAYTGIPTYALGMPIHQNREQEFLSDLHLEWLRNNFENVKTEKFNLTEAFDVFKNTMVGYDNNKLALANSRSRLRMVTLYQVAASVNGIVVGTGNKVEDYGVGFYTKYGDGGVDISPIANLYKTEVWKLGSFLGINQSIIDAKPTDGLWDDGRTDEEQIGTTYEMLEWVMEIGLTTTSKDFSAEQVKALNAYEKFNKNNLHKMISIPTFKL